ncbi:MarR family transcriptional regulator [Salibacterium salarium]|uniref:MarR family transcriptional regulator n=1 Tax=Salibacterium salarium TaxID=284579 RepID=A0A3R9P3U7_9BACI|nr:MarR family transcriptional regulator [Salibacterium salarium]RSL32231.1 MarR family transcriptional regulator [Salibacterium salarium]
MADQTQVAGIEKSLRHVSYIVKQKGREILNQFPITPPQFVALQWLQEEGEMTIGGLSQKISLACSTTTDLVDRMEKNDLVERVKDKKDRRVVYIHLLEKGENIIKEVVKERQLYLHNILSHFSAEEVRNVEQSIMMLHDCMTSVEVEKEREDIK